MKKTIAMLLSLMMLAMPFAGIAETVEAADPYTRAIDAGRRVTTTITVGELPEDMTGVPEVDQILRDLISAISYTEYQQQDEQYFSVGLKQEDGQIAELLSFGAAFSDVEAFISSNLFGGTIAMSEEGVPNLLARLADMFALMGLFTEDEAEQMKAQIPELIEIATAQAETTLAAAQAEELDMLALDYSAITEIAEPIIDRMESAEVTMQPKNCDAADTVMTVSITGDELAALSLSWLRLVLDNPELTAIAEASYNAALSEMAIMVTEEIPSFTESLEQIIAEMEQELSFVGEATVALYLDTQGLPVYMEIRLPEQVAYDYSSLVEAVSYTYVPTITFTRLTMNDSVAYSFVMVVDEESITMNLVDKGTSAAINLTAVMTDGLTLGFNIDVTDRSAENLTAWDAAISLNVLEEERYGYEFNAVTGQFETVTLDPMTTEIVLKLTNDTALNGVDFSSHTSATIGVNGMDYCTIFVDVASGEPGMSIMDGEVFRPAEMTDADFANWFVGAYNSIYNWANTLILSLPDSVLNLLMY